MKVYSLVNQKGGVGKTFLTVMLSRYLVAIGARVLLIDSDGQNSLTFHYLDNEDQTKGKSIVSAVMNNNLSDNIVKIDHGIDIVASSYQLSNLRSMNTNTYKKLINDQAILDNYDYVLIDTPPDINNFNIAAAFASDKIIIPFTQNSWAIKTSANTINSLLDTIDSLSKDNFFLVANMVGRKSDNSDNINFQYEEMCAEWFGELFAFENSIPLSREFNKIIDRNEPMSQAKTKIKIYSALCDIFEKLTGVPRPEKF